MIFKRFFDPKLAQATYLIACSSTREALVVDPNRDIDVYLQAAASEGLRIAHVTETHIHADFVSGARELSHRTGARLYLSGAGGPDWSYRYTANESHPSLLQEGASFNVGRVEVQVWHVPGHTPEHLAFLVIDTEKASEPMGAFTGDFLFVGDVGRPDLLERAVQMAGTMEKAARELFRSLQRFRELPDYLQIWPGHGAGSACGKSLSAVPQSTLGYEKRFNWAFGILDEPAFVSAVLAGQPEPPRYFARMKRINQSGPALGDISRPARMPEAALETALAAGDSVVDTRRASDYMVAAISGTLNIPANRSFTTWAGSLLPYDRDIYLILDASNDRLVDELTRDLAGIGLDRVVGYFGLEVIDAWSKRQGPLQSIASISLAEFARFQGRKGEVVVDVRGEDEWRNGHIPEARHLPLVKLEQRLDELPRGRPLIVHCQTGSRAAIAASLLKASGFSDVRLFTGGFAAWRAAGKPVEVE